MANKRLPLKEQLKVLYNTPEELGGLNDLCIKMTGKTLGYGGIVYIQDPGEKKKDSIYLDKFKPGLYYCKANSTTTSNDTSIFIDYSNYTIGNKLENLYPDDNKNNIIRIGNFNIEFSFVPYSGSNGVREYDIISNFKHIYGVSLTPVASEGSVVSNEQMLQILHSFNSSTKKVRFTAKYNQTVFIMIIGILK